MKVTLRTIQAPLNDYFEGAMPKTTPRQLLRKMVANPDFQKFKSIQKRADQGDVRFHFTFPEESADKISLSIADRKNPTSTDVAVILDNMFKRKKNREQLPTMTTKEFFGFFKDVAKGVFFPHTVSKYPVKKVEFNPSEPYAEKISTALREFANDRLFGSR